MRHRVRWIKPCRDYNSITLYRQFYSELSSTARLARDFEPLFDSEDTFVYGKGGTRVNTLNTVFSMKKTESQQKLPVIEYAAN
jgi:hypothetical protein